MCVHMFSISTGLSGHDLNRCWTRPQGLQQPTIKVCTDRTAGYLLLC